MPTVRTAKHLLLESTTKSVESGTYDVICHFCTVKGMVVESEVLMKAQSCALSKLSLPMHSNGASAFRRYHSPSRLLLEVTFFSLTQTTAHLAFENDELKKKRPRNITHHC